jgi:hypothetical protein
LLFSSFRFSSSSPSFISVLYSSLSSFCLFYPLYLRTSISAPVFLLIVVSPFHCFDWIHPSLEADILSTEQLLL